MTGKELARETKRAAKEVPRGEPPPVILAIPFDSPGYEAYIEMLRAEIVRAISYPDHPAHPAGGRT